MEERRYNDFWSFIKLLSDNGLLDHVVLIGSWAEYVYAQSGILPGFEANLRTIDIDFLVKNLRRPNPKASVVNLARDAGYTVDYDRLTGATKIFTPDLMEIEFLITQQGAGSEATLQTNLGVTAQALRHTSILRDHTIKVELFGMGIHVPEPEAYVIHKAVINHERKGKRDKDREAILNLLSYISRIRLKELEGSLGRREFFYYNEFMKEIV